MRDADSARRFFRRALSTSKVKPTEVVTDAAAVYPGVLDARATNGADRTSDHRWTCLHAELATRPRGEVHLGGVKAAMVAATSVNLALRTADEQAALIDTFGRWLNSLSTPTQIVVSAQPVDLHSAARTLAQAADRMPHPALADAAADHARFLDDLAALPRAADRLIRQVQRSRIERWLTLPDG